MVSELSSRWKVVEKKSQGMAWTVVDKTRPIMETGINNLTEDTAPARAFCRRPDAAVAVGTAGRARGRRRNSRTVTSTAFSVARNQSDPLRVLVGIPHSNWPPRNWKSALVVCVKQSKKASDLHFVFWDSADEY